MREADEAIALDGTTAAETYLDTGKVLAAAKRTGADAIHPGYGFLSENASFAKAVTDAGLVFVGPSPEAMAAMGDKIRAKELMEKAGVPVLPSATLEETSDVRAAGDDVGYPLLVKASAGGGGRGMRLVEDGGDLEDAVAAAMREAEAAFGDGRVFLERYVPVARHIELQILGDQHGHLVHLFERECSIQRRHQKIIEEAPSSAVDPALRAQMGDAAVAAGKAVDYVSAGTVEFLFADAAKGKDAEFWFLEMNTRLQVEHPVTEEITGLDLVREQLLVAQGYPLTVKQYDLSITGHAIEARLYAEDPANEFLPATGTVSAWVPGTGGPSQATARFDSGIESGSLVGTRFDPMLAKVIVHAPTRQEAALRLARVLETTRIEGTTTNRDFLVSTLRTAEFLAGDTTTDFIERIAPKRTAEPGQTAVEDAAVLAALGAQEKRRARVRLLPHVPSGFRNTPMPPERVSYLATGSNRNGEPALVEVEYRAQRFGTPGEFSVQVGERPLTARVLSYTDTDNGAEIEAEIDGHQVRASLGGAMSEGADVFVHGPFGSIALTLQPRFPSAKSEAASGDLVAPMPGSVIAVHAEVGAKVEAGTLLLILEAMKMEHRITAPHDGEILEVRVAEGDQVATGELLVQIGDSS